MFSYLPKSYMLQTATMIGINPSKHKKWQMLSHVPLKPKNEPKLFI